MIFVYFIEDGNLTIYTGREERVKTLAGEYFARFIYFYADLAPVEV